MHSVWVVGVCLFVDSVFGARAGYGEYCSAPEAGRHFNSSEWVETPWCEENSVQASTEYVGRPIDYLDDYQEVDLSEPQYDGLFCCHSNYTTLIPRNVTVEYLDDKAQKYQAAAERLLSRYNCDDFYPFMNCTPCQYAYRSWVCSVMFPRKCRDSTDSQIIGHVQKVCKDVCYEVVRKCPVELEFHCPTDASYGDWGREVDWDSDQFGPFRGKCNPMQYNIKEAAAAPYSMLSVYGALSAALWCVLL